MSANIDLNSLPSVAVREALDNGGIREIDIGEAVNVDVDNGFDFWSVLKRTALALKGFIGLNVMFPQIAPFTTAWGFAVQGAQFLWTFDFNASDEQLDAQMSSIKTILAGQIGGTLGNAFGYLVCGVIPSAVVLKFNQPLGVYLLKEVGEEALEEFVNNLAVLCRTSFYMGVRYLLTTAYKSARRAIKKWLLGSGNAKGEIARRLFGEDFDDKVKAWGDGKEVWSFSTTFNSFIENIPIPWLQELAEEAWEEALDACTEAGYIVARGLDDWYLKQKLERDNALGQERGVEIIPDREAESERVVMVGAERMIRPAMVQFMTNYQLVENRDLGQFMGEPVREYLKAAPTKLSVKLVWSRFETPPMFRDGVYRPPSLEIKDFKRSMLDFDLIKNLMGGINGRDWGRFWASCSLVDIHGTIVSRPKLFAGSEQEAVDLLTSLLTLTDLEIGTMSAGEEKKVGRKASGRAMAKELTRVYPAYMTIFNAEKVINEAEGRAQISGSYKRRNDRLSLWTSTKPSNWEETITELLTATGADSPTP